MKTHLLIIAIIPLIAAGCATSHNSSDALTPATPPAIALHHQIADAQTSLQNAGEPLTQSAAHIVNARLAVLTADNTTATNELDAAETGLRRGKEFVDKAGAAMNSALDAATQTVAAAQHSDKTVKNLAAERDALRAKLQSQSAWVFKLLLTAAAALIAGGIGLGVTSVMMGFASVRAGATISAGGVMLLVLTLTLQHYEKQIIIGGGIFLLLVGAYLGWKLFASAKANKELVEFGEALKAAAPADLKTLLFGADDTAVPHSVADSLQSDSTQAIVKQLRQYLQTTETK